MALRTGNPLAISSNAWASIRRFGVDDRDSTLTQKDFDDLARINKDYGNQARWLYDYTYRLRMGDFDLTEYIKNLRYWYNYQPNFNGVTALPDIPVGATRLDYIYFIQSQSVANSLGSTTVDDIPTTWRNATGVFRINMERQNLSNAQQVGIVKGLEREILAGMSKIYTSTSTSNRYIDFQNGSSHSNDDLVQADLVTEGWTIVNGTQMEKMISADGAAARRWRVLHN